MLSFALRFGSRWRAGADSDTTIGNPATRAKPGPCGAVRELPSGSRNRKSIAFGSAYRTGQRKRREESAEPWSARPPPEESRQADPTRVDWAESLAYATIPSIERPSFLASLRGRRGSSRSVRLSDEVVSLAGSGLARRLEVHGGRIRLPAQLQGGQVLAAAADGARRRAGQGPI